MDNERDDTANKPALKSNARIGIFDIKKVKIPKSLSLNCLAKRPYTNIPAMLTKTFEKIDKITLLNIF